MKTTKKMGATVSVSHLRVDSTAPVKAYVVPDGSPSAEWASLLAPVQPLIDNADEAIVVTSADNGSIVHCNQAWCKLCG